jgi:hypothetical protein
VLCVLFNSKYTFISIFPFLRNDFEKKMLLDELKTEEKSWCKSVTVPPGIFHCSRWVLSTRKRITCLVPELKT